MPLGDSITDTESLTGVGSYRYYLWQQLRKAGFLADFVGSMGGVSGILLKFSDFDTDHEGHYGWRADQVLGQILGWATATRPHIVLIHLGHNDLWQGKNVTSTVNDLGAIIDILRLVNSRVRVLLAQVIASSDPGLQLIPQLNQGIAKLVAAKSRPESPLVAVDQYTGFDPILMTWDGVHPNDAGARRIADRWFTALIPHLNALASTTKRP